MSETDIQKQILDYLKSVDHTLSFEGNTLSINPPGVSLQDLGAFFETALGNAGLADLIPESIFQQPVRLTNLSLTPENKALSFGLEWDSTLEVMPGVVSVEKPGFLIDVVDTYASAKLWAITEIAGVGISVSLNTPSFTFGAGTVSPIKIAPILQHFQIEPGPFEDLDVQFQIEANALLRRVVTHVEIQNLKLGLADVTLDDAQLDVVYAGSIAGLPSSTSGSIYGRLSIDQTVLELLAAHGGPGLGWQFAGSVRPEQSLKEIADGAGKLFGISNLGDALPVDLTNLELGFTSDTHTKNASIHFQGDLDAIKGSVILDARLNRGPNGYDKFFSGKLLLTFGEAEASGSQSNQLQPQSTGPEHANAEKNATAPTPADQLEFDIIFDQKSSGKTFIALYKNTGGGKLSLKHLIEAVSGESIASLDSLSFKIKDVLLLYEPPQKPSQDPSTTNTNQSHNQNLTASRYLVALDMDAGVDLSSLGSLPLIGKLLPRDQALRLAFEPIVVSQTPPSDDIRSLLPEGSPHLPDQLSPGFSFVTTLRFGDFTRSIDFGASAQTSKIAPQTGTPLQQSNGKALVDPLVDPDLGSPSLAPASAASAADPAGAVASQPQDVNWFDLQKHFGPLHLQRAGLGFHDGKIAALLDAALAIGPLEIALLGLGAEYDLKSKALSFSLDGLAIDFKRGPLEISAAFLRFNEDFAGKAILRTEALTLGAFGAYGEHSGHPSLFIYAFLDFPIGGPVFFFVEGLAVGFGYNRNLIMPPVDKISTFPLVSEVIGTTAPPSNLTGDADPTAAVDGIRSQIAMLEQYIPPQVGQYFFTVGLKFNSFRLIDCFALLALSAGQHVEIDILGVATLIVPTPEEGVAVDPLAEIQMAFVARFAPEEGFLGVQAQLTSNSFLLSRNCHLQGGFAFYGWLGGEHAGDFVVTIGGYHPHFQVPAHYPQVPRVGFNWRVNDHFTIKGGMYYALTPTAVMAGGSLSANWESGDMQAWFDLGLDLLMAWKPYHYEANAHVEIGAAVTVHFFGTHHVTINAGAELDIWGPDFAGVAHVHVKVFHVPVDFTVHFGDKSSLPSPLTWDQFQQSFLPRPESRCNLAVQQGLIRTYKESDSVESWIVNPKELVIVSDSVIPSKEGYRDSTTTSDAPQAQEKLNSSNASAIVGIAPMAVTSDAFTSKQMIRVIRHGDDGLENRTNDFSFRPVVKRYPAAMWGQSRDPNQQLNAGMIEALAGYEIRPAKPAKTAETSPIERQYLAYDIAPRQLAGDDPEIGYAAYDLPEWDNGSFQPIKASLADADTRASQGSLLRALGFEPLTAVELSDTLVDTFVLAPAIVQTAKITIGED